MHANFPRTNIPMTETDKKHAVAALRRIVRQLAGARPKDRHERLRLGALAVFQINRIAKTTS